MKPNKDIRCRVGSCRYNADKDECCTLEAIEVEPCADCCSGKVEDESCCGSYRHR